MEHILGLIRILVSSGTFWVQKAVTGSLGSREFHWIPFQERAAYVAALSDQKSSPMQARPARTLLVIIL